MVYPNVTPGSKEFESMVGEVLNELGVLSERVEAGKDDGYDFEIKTQEQNYIVEVKRYSKLLGLATAREFIYKVNQSGKGGILIVSSGFTERTKQLINEHNALSENQKVYLVVAKAKTELKGILAKILRL
ncbi:restriction endonuclease [Rahnella sp. GSA61A]|uniref:restriction endonuclease n=1 Tax=Rahnella sp. GSA61A TaxID=2862678 RepID=UPI002104FD24|nr:restriction endonuclease [Rahnella sp. GSA61A]